LRRNGDGGRFGSRKRLRIPDETERALDALEASFDGFQAAFEQAFHPDLR
jgi:hypothetical protein